MQLYADVLAPNKHETVNKHHDLFVTMVPYESYLVTRLTALHPLNKLCSRQVEIGIVFLIVGGFAFSVREHLMTGDEEGVGHGADQLIVCVMGKHCIHEAISLIIFLSQFKFYDNIISFWSKS